MNKRKLKADLHVHRVDSPSAILTPLTKKNKVSRTHTYGFDIEVDQILSILSYSLPMGSKDMQVFENFILFSLIIVSVSGKTGFQGKKH